MLQSDTLMMDGAGRDWRLEAETAAPVVAIYRTQILAKSEAFVRDQALALRRWRPVLLGQRRIDGLALDGLTVAALDKGAGGALQSAAAAVWRSLDRAPPGLWKLARRQNPRLIHAHFGFDGVEAWPVARRLNVPLLVTLHGSDITTRMKWFAEGKAGRRWQSYPYRLRAMAQAGNVTFVAVSENIRHAALAAGLPGGRIFVRPLGVDTGRFAPSAPPVARRAPVVLFMGHLAEKKGLAYLLDGFEIVRRQLPNAELVIAGDGPERQKLAARAAKMGNVRFVGGYTPEQARELLGQARVLCLPSVTAESGDAEGLGIVILEAQASGVPVVTSARGGATEGMLDGGTGFAFKERDVEAMSAHLLTVLRDDELAARLSEAAVAFARERFDLESCTAALEDLYDCVADGRV
jgi:glycosyltransferase involved in cell wall biosynthesis